MAAPTAKKGERGKAGACHFIQPPDFIKSKAVQGRGVDLTTVEEQAQAMVSALKGEYLERVKSELAILEKAVDSIRKGAPEERGGALRTLSHISHEITGQAGTFGFELITTIGNSLCEFVAELDDPTANDLKAIEIHADAIRVVISQKIQGSGGEIGQHLLTGIEAMVAKVRAR